MGLLREHALSPLSSGQQGEGQTGSANFAFLLRRADQAATMDCTGALRSAGDLLLDKDRRVFASPPLDHFRITKSRRAPSRSERGASAVEYGLLITGIAALIVVVVFALGGRVTGMYSNTCKSVTSTATC
jgi:pilus assembly protein Flp/PilA